MLVVRQFCGRPILELHSHGTTPVDKEADEELPSADEPDALLAKVSEMLAKNRSGDVQHRERSSFNQPPLRFLRCPARPPRGGEAPGTGAPGSHRLGLRLAQPSLARSGQVDRTAGTLDNVSPFRSVTSCVTRWSP